MAKVPRKLMEKPVKVECLDPRPDEYTVPQLENSRKCERSRAEKAEGQLQQLQQAVRVREVEPLK